MKKTCVIMCIVAWVMLSCVACGGKHAEGQLQSSVETNHQENTEVSQAVSDTLAINKPEDNHLKCLVQIQTDVRLGSGILWDRQKDVWTFVTAAHVVEGAKQAEVCFVPENKKYSARVYIVKGVDLAFLQVDVARLEDDIKDNYAMCISVDTEVRSGETVSAMGYSASGERKSYTGTVQEPWIYVEDFDNYMLLCEVEAEAGMSGGGVFTKDGEIAGIICGENDAGQLAVLPTIVIEGEYGLFINY
ncbi:MAG: trypsin-like peptidase domain-containing protein [Lachnospiraceae bacterium]|nr:trypsin-like peptidase domain-containing protein [Lachnospiraceae bacterium]